MSTVRLILNYCTALDPRSCPLFSPQTLGILSVSILLSRDGKLGRESRNIWNAFLPQGVTWALIRLADWDLMIIHRTITLPFITMSPRDIHPSGVIISLRVTSKQSKIHSRTFTHVASNPTISVMGGELKLILACFSLGFSSCFC